MKIEATGLSGEDVVKEAFWLAYVACGSPAGMGLLQSKPNSTKDDVWGNVRSAGDYPGGQLIMGANKPGEAYGDYVFGRMMKMGLRWDGNTIDVPENKPRYDYQSWCGVYPSYQALVEAAIESLRKQAAA